MKMKHLLPRSLTVMAVLMSCDQYITAETVSADAERQPIFLESVANVTVALGRDASLTCVVDHLGTHKVAWIHLDRQMIVSIHKHVIARQPRFTVTHDSLRTWTLHVNGVTQDDRGTYMCQVNSNPMISQTGFLQVVVPPEIADEASSPSSLTVSEYDNVTLVCRADGFPEPRIRWRREDKSPIKTSTVTRGASALEVDGEMLKLATVSRTDSGAYLCIASNGVPPTVSKRVMLAVQFSPQLRVPSQLVGTPPETEITLECLVEAYPHPVTYWTKGDIMVSNTTRIEAYSRKNFYKIHMFLIIRDLQEDDFGQYLCIAKNSLAETNGSIKLYKVPKPTRTPIERKRNPEKNTGWSQTRVSGRQKSNPNTRGSNHGSNNRLNLNQDGGTFEQPWENGNDIHRYDSYGDRSLYDSQDGVTYRGQSTERRHYDSSVSRNIFDTFSSDVEGMCSSRLLLSVTLSLCFIYRL